MPEAARRGRPEIPAREHVSKSNTYGILAQCCMATSRASSSPSAHRSEVHKIGMHTWHTHHDTHARTRLRVRAHAPTPRGLHRPHDRLTHMHGVHGALASPPRCRLRTAAVFSRALMVRSLPLLVVLAAAFGRGAKSPPWGPNAHSPLIPTGALFN